MCSCRQLLEAVTTGFDMTTGDMSGSGRDQKRVAHKNHCVEILFPRYPSGEIIPSVSIKSRLVHLSVDVNLTCYFSSRYMSFAEGIALGDVNFVF